MSPDRLKRRTVKKPVFSGNLLKPQQVIGHINVAVNDGQEDMPDTIIINGTEVKLTKEKPLPKPTEDGTYWWQQD